MKKYEKRINKQKQMDKQKSQNRRYFFLLSLSLINQKKWKKEYRDGKKRDTS